MWDEVAGQEGFERVTLFNGVPVEQQSAEMIATRMRAVLSELRPEVVAVPGWHDRCALVALKWCCDEGVPTVVMSETTPWDYERKWWKEAFKRRIVRCFAAGFVGGTSHAQYLETLGMVRERVFLGYDAVDNRYFAEKAVEIRNQKSEIRNTFGLPENYFLASARFVEKKNLPRLIQAYTRYRELAENTESLKPETLKSEMGSARASRAVAGVPPGTSLAVQTVSPGTAQPAAGTAALPKSENQNKKPETLKSENTSPRPSPRGGEGGVTWDLVLLGDGELRSSLKSQVSSLRLSEQVQMPGFKQYPDLPAYYGLAGAFIHASTTEQWGLVVNEAMASGLPVLVSNRCGCASDLVQHGVNGFTFDPYNVEEMAQLMFQVSTSQPSKLSAYGSACRRIIADWGPERFASGLKAAVDKALEVGTIKPALIQHLSLKALLAR
jgi:glycosyltransferase involved in cell wall biosynthesis